MKLGILLASLMLVLVGCDQKGSPDSTKERAKAEQEANSDVENRNLAEKAKKMESDLTDRHFFYSAIAGQYQGVVTVAEESYNIKFNLVVSIPPYTGERVRQLSEIENDLNNLYFHMQVVQWHPEDSSSAVGCRVSGIKPDMQKGVMTIASADCPNLYTIYITDLSSRLSNLEEKAAQLANRLKNRELDTIKSLTGTIHPSSNAATYNFTANRLR